MPDAFLWSCCERPFATAGNGCRRGRHQADPDRAFRTDDKDAQSDNVDSDGESDESTDEEDYEDFYDESEHEQDNGEPPSKKQRL